MKKFSSISIFGGMIALAALGVSPYAMAFGLSSLMGHHGNKGANAQILKQQSKLVHDFSGAQKQTLTAQALLAQAFGMKTQAAVLRADAKALGSGASAQDIEKSVGDSSSVNKAIQKNMKSGVKMSAQGKKLYIKAVPHYAKGVTETIGLRPDITGFGNGARKAIESASIADKLSLKNKLAAGMYIAEHSPSYIGELEKTTGEILSYSKKEKIAIPKSTLSSIPMD